VRRVLRDAPATLDLDVVDGDGETLAGDVTGFTVAAGSAGVALTGSPFTGTLDPEKPGQLSLTIPAASLTVLDDVDVTWNVARTSGDETHREQLRVVGGFLYEARQLRARFPDLADPTKYTPGDVRANRDAIEALFADVCYVSFVPVADRLEVPGSWSSTLLSLDQLHVTAIRSATVDGVALTTPELDELVLYRDTGHVHRPSGWRANRIVIVFEHGLADVPADVHLAALNLARATLVPSAAPSRATSVDSNGATYRLTLAGRDGTTGYPDVDATLARYGADASLVAT
jgi:hypothetical protein